MNEDAPPLSIYDTDLDQAAANYVPLTPLSFLQRSSIVYPDKTAVIHGDHQYSYREFADRCRRLASALNYRLDAASISFILEHAQTKVLITDREFSETISEVIKNVKQPLLVIDIDDPLYEGGELLGECDYESFLLRGKSDFVALPLEDEWQAISLNYTSGTTGNPKGVVYHHRGAYLNALGCYRGRGHACMPTSRRSSPDLPHDQATRRESHVWRPHCAQHVGACADRATGRLRPHGGSSHRRCGAT